MPYEWLGVSPYDIVMRYNYHPDLGIITKERTRGESLHSGNRHTVRDHRLKAHRKGDGNGSIHGAAIDPRPSAPSVQNAVARQVQA